MKLVNGSDIGELMMRMLDRSWAAGLLLSLVSMSVVADERTGPELAATISPRLAKFHAEAKPSERPLRVVYFHPSDVEPLPQYHERLTRIMLDIQEFYLSEMERNGFGSKTFPLERDGDSLVIHVVKGQDTADGYDHDSGDKVRREVAAAVAEKFRLASEFVLIVNAMCRTEEDGSYFFYAPYYGNGGARNGVCHVADCELMDTRNYTETDKRIRYVEHYGKRNQTLAGFSCLYIGGIAHELGHAFGYQHNQEKPWETQRHGTALMGSGNFTFRHELRGKPGTFMTFATSMQLASHPLFARVELDDSSQTETSIESLEFAQEDRRLIIRGEVKSNVEPYAVIAFTNPKIEHGWQNEDYDALTWNAEVVDGKFTVVAKRHSPGRSGLKLRFCHLDGTQSNFKFEYDADEDGRPSADDLNSQWHLRQVETAYLDGDRKLAARLAKEKLDAVDEEAQRKLQHMSHLTTSSKLRALAEVDADEVYLSECEWTEADVGWGKPARDQYYSDKFIRDAVFVELNGTFYPRALYAHAPSRYVFDLGGKWKQFRAVAGLQTGAGGDGTGVFTVIGDGKELFRSKRLSANLTEEVDVDVSGVQRLELVIKSGKRGNARCWTMWGNPRLTR